MQLKRSSLLVALLLACASRAAAEEPGPPAPSAPPGGAAPAAPDAASVAATPTDDARKVEARARFERGVALFEEEAWDAALAEFGSSRAMFPTRNATKNAAICLRKLHRFDEAVEMFEALLRDFPGLPPEDRAVAEGQIKELGGFVGTFSLIGAEPGAKILLDGRERGETPQGPLRASAGTHLLRVLKEGFAPFELQITVAGGQNVAANAKLSPLLQGGRLRVEEASGQIIDVVVDGAVVGKTPWEGMLTVGDHVVALRGEGNLGTQPSGAGVRLNAATAVTLRAEPLASTLRVKPDPAGATVAIDGVTLGHGGWTGPVRVGDHVIDVRAEGFVVDQRRVRTAPGQELTVDVKLRQARGGSDEKPGRLFLEVDGAAALVPSLGGDLAGSCKGSCSPKAATGFVVMGHGGYQLGSGLGFLIDAGYLSASTTLSDRPVTLHPRGIADNAGTATDDLKLAGLLVGPSAMFHFGESFPFLARFGVGALLGSLDDDRTGTATTNQRADPSGGPDFPAQSYTFDRSESLAARYFYVSPEARIGVRFAERFEVTAGVRALFLVAMSQPKWQDESPVVPGAAYHVGELTFGADSAAGGVVVVVAPGIAARFDF